MIDLRYKQGGVLLALIWFAILSVFMVYGTVMAAKPNVSLVSPDNIMLDQAFDLTVSFILLGYTVYMTCRAFKSRQFRRTERTYMTLTQQGTGRLQWSVGEVEFALDPSRGLELSGNAILLPEKADIVGKSGRVWPYNKPFRKIRPQAKLLKGGRPEIARQVEAFNAQIKARDGAE